MSFFGGPPVMVVVLLVLLENHHNWVSSKKDPPTFFLKATAKGLVHLQAFWVSASPDRRCAILLAKM